MNKLDLFHSATVNWHETNIIKKNTEIMKIKQLKKQDSFFALAW